MEPAIDPVLPPEAVNDVIGSLIRRLDVLCYYCSAVIWMNVIQIGPVPQICYDSTDVIGQTFVRVRNTFLRPCRNHRRHTIQDLPGLTLARLKGLSSLKLLVDVDPDQVPAGFAAFLMG